MGRGRLPALRPQPAGPAPTAEVQDQLLRLRHRLRPGHVQRRRRDRSHPHLRGRQRGTGIPGLHSRRPRHHTVPGARPGGLHPEGGPTGHHRGGTQGLRADRQPGQQAEGTPQVGGGPAGHRRGSTSGAGHPHAAARLGHLAWRHPAGGHRMGRRAGRCGRRRDPHRHGSGNPRGPRRQERLRPLGGGQRGPGRRQRHRLGLRLVRAGRRHVRPVPGRGIDGP